MFRPLWKRQTEQMSNQIGCKRFSTTTMRLDLEDNVTDGIKIFVLGHNNAVTHKTKHSYGMVWLFLVIIKLTIIYDLYTY